MVERLLFTGNADLSKPKIDGVGLAKYYEKRKMQSTLFSSLQDSD